MEKKTIEKIPPLPEKIKNAVDNNELVIFFGAGASRILGCQGWIQLAHNLVDACFNSVNNNDERLLSFQEKESLKSDTDQKKVISICYNILKSHNKSEVFYHTLKSSLLADKSKLESLNIYTQIHNFNAVIVTTNIDNHLSDIYTNNRVIYNVEDLVGSFSNTKLYQLHGNLEADPEDIVIKVTDYFNRYSKPKFQNFLKRLFREKTILFIGYGLSEFEVLDYLLLKSKPLIAQSKHYLLHPYYSYEVNTYGNDRLYFKDLGIEIIPYAIDENGYEQLFKVLQNWNNRLLVITDVLASDLKKIERCTDQFNKKCADEVFQIISNSSEKEQHFYRELAKCREPRSWLNYLIEHDVFNINRIPPVEIINQEKNEYRFPYWLQVGYIINIAKHNQKKKLRNVNKFLEDLLKNYINNWDKISNPPNYFNDREILSIMATIPGRNINNTHLLFIKKLLFNSFNNEIFITVIYESILPNLLKSKNKLIAVKLVEIIVEYIFNNRNEQHYHNDMMIFYFQEMMRHNQLNIMSAYPIEFAQILIKQTRKFVNHEKNEYHLFFYTSVERLNERQVENVELVLLEVLRDIFIKNNKLLKKELNELLDDKRYILNRIAYYVINKKYIQYSVVFWQSIKKIKTSHYNQEFIELLQSKSHLFTDVQLKKLCKLIENIIVDIEFNGGKAFIQYELINCLKASNNQIIIERINFYKNLIPPENQPLQKKKKLENKVTQKKEHNVASVKSAKEKINMLKKYTIDNISTEELRVITNDVKANYELYYKILPRLTNISCSIHDAIITAYEDLWKNENEVDINLIMNFYNNLVKKENILIENFREGEINYCNRFIYSICNFILEGYKTDSYSFDSSQISICKNILLNLHKIIKSECGDPEHALFQYLNSSVGKYFDAIVNVSLFELRNNISKEWDIKFKSIVENYLMRFEENYEFDLMLGIYYRNLLFLDKKWLEENFDRVFPIGLEKHWKATMIGFLWRLQSVDKELYKKLKQKGHLEKLITAKFKEKNIEEKFYQYVCIAYLNDIEKFSEDSILWKIIHQKDISKINYIIWFIWTLRKDKTQGNDKKYKVLWKTFEGLKYDSKTEQAEVYSQLCLWIDYINDFDSEAISLIKKILPFVETKHNLPRLIDSFLLKVDNHPERVAELYIYILEKGILPRFYNEKTKSIVVKLREKGLNEQAREIGNYFLKAGIKLEE